MTVARTVRPIHFEDFSGAEFERLVFAYHLCEGWVDLAWFGQTGSDQGRDIIGLRPSDGRPAERTVIQCVNRDSLTGCDPKWCNQAVRRSDLFGLLSLAAAARCRARAFQ